MIPTLGGQTATIATRVFGAKDNLGVPSVTITTVDVPNCSLQPHSGAHEKQGNTDEIVSEWKLFIPPEYSITGVDYVLFNNVKYEVLGDPQPWYDFVGGFHHSEIFLRRATG